jgi:cell filamentation protein
MYQAPDDPDCYPGTLVLNNLAGLRDQADWDVFEAASTLQRADEPLPPGRLSFTHYRAIHRHLFQDVYPFAGKLRTVRLAKGGSAFCYPEHIKREADILFETLRAKRGLQGLNTDDFALAAADFLATLNAIHPFAKAMAAAKPCFSP